MASHPILEMKNVTVELGGDIILKNINLSVEPGETLVLIGPSGGGKTVLLKTLAAVFVPKSGQVFCEGENWQNLQSEEKRKLALHIGVQFQKSALFDALTTFENVAFPLREHYPEMPENEITKNVEYCLKAVDLWSAKNQMPHELSGGQRLRLGVARAIVLKPKIIFYDDPTAGLDPINTDKMLELIVRLKKEHQSTLVIATHSMFAAYQLAGRIVLVCNQEIIETGSAAQAKSHTDPRVQQFIQGKLTGPLKWG